MGTKKASSGFNISRLFPNISVSSTDREINLAYRAAIKQCHPDKVAGKEDLAKEVTEAYNAIKNADPETRKKLFSEGGLSLAASPDAANTLIDKSVSERFRSLFLANEQVAKITRFQNNFETFYTTVLDFIEVDGRRPSRDFGCEVCGEKFSSEEEHFERRLGGYLSIFQDEGLGQEAFLQSFYDQEDEAGWILEPGTGVSPIWNDEDFWSGFVIRGTRVEVLDLKQTLKTVLEKWEPISVPGHEEIKLIQKLQDMGFKDWNATAKSLMRDKSKVVLAMVLAKAGSLVEPDKDCWTELGLLAATHDLPNLAFQCFTLGCCDIIESVLPKLISGGHQDCAAKIIFKVKRNQKERQLELLKKVLVPSQLWSYINALVVEDPEVAEFPIVAKLFFEQMKKSLTTLQKFNDLPTGGDPFESILLGFLAKLTFDDLDLAMYIKGMMGALHILHESDSEGFKAWNHWVWTTYVPALIDYLASKDGAEDFSLLIQLGMFPGSKSGFKNFLTQKRFLGPGKITPQKGVGYHGRLLVLLGIYRFHEGQIMGMTTEFEAALLTCPGNEAIASGIARFISETGALDQILGLIPSQLRSMEGMVDSYEALHFLLNEVTVKTRGIYEEVYSIPGLQNIITYEREIIGREEKVHRSHLEFLEIGYGYLDLSLICETVTTHLAALINAAANFYQGMTLVSDSTALDMEKKIPLLFAYRGILLAVMEELSFCTLNNSSPDQVLYVRKTRLGFTYAADLTFSLALKKLFKEDPGKQGFTSFIDTTETEGSLSSLTIFQKNLQEVVILRRLVPLGNTSLYTIYDSVIVQQAYGTFFSNFIQILAEDKGSEYSFLYEHFLFNRVWKNQIELEWSDSGENSEEEEVEDSDSEKDNEMNQPGFIFTRGQAMISHASKRGYEIEDVEVMMGWSPLQRTPDGFLDPANPTLDFRGEVAYSSFNGFSVDTASGRIYWLVTPAVPGDPTRPPLFTMTDIAEIWEGEIHVGFLSFDEEYNKCLPQYQRLYTPDHPFFKVRYGPPQICGTNYLMTLYHLDLLAKMFTTGQEISASFPFQFRDTLTGILKDLPKGLKEALSPIGPRKEYRRLRQFERINRFYFMVDSVEEELVQGRGDNPTYYYVGNVELTLKTEEMLRDVHTMETMDVASEEGTPEKAFVSEFNSNMEEISTHFPIISRAKQLAKISNACSTLRSNQTNMCKSDFQNHGDFQWIFGKRFLEGTQKPYSSCTWSKGQIEKEFNGKKNCGCCNWVPAAFHQIKVTDVQKLEYILGNNRFRRNGKAVGEEEEKLRLMYSESFGGQSQEPEDDEGKREQEPPGQEAGGRKKNESDIGGWTGMNDYRVYGGVVLAGPGKSVTGLGNRVGNWTKESLASLQARTQQGRTRVSQRDRAPPAAAAASAGGTGGGGGGDGGDDGGKAKGKVRDAIKKRRLPEKGEVKFEPPKDKSGREVLKRVKKSGRSKETGIEDKYGNKWFKGPSRTLGEDFEWDVELSNQGLRRYGSSLKPGQTHLNVSLEGRITH